MSKEVLLSHLDQIHTTQLGLDRIKNNLEIYTEDVLLILKQKILEKDCFIYQKGKNWYCEIQNIRITINSNNYCVITAHRMKQ